MSLTPGWKEKEFMDFLPGLPVTFNLTKTQEWLYLDNVGEYAEFPNNKQGWSDLCDRLKDLEP